MARSRNIKPGFFTNDVLGDLPPLTRLLFAGTWTICDREGRLEDRPKKIKAEVLPYDNCDPDSMLSELEKHGFIQRYETGGFKVIQVVSWAKHQNPHVKEAPSTLPAPDKNSASTVQASDKEQPLPERAGLIPSSLIPDSSPLIPDSSGGRAPRKRSAPSVKPMATVDELVQAGFPADTAAEFIAHKAGMKAPLTERAWRDHLAEAEKAGWTPLQAAEKVMAKSWKGFEAKYVIGERPPVASRQSFADHDEQKRRARWEEMTGRKWPTSGDVIDAEITQPRIAA